MTAVRRSLLLLELASAAACQDCGRTAACILVWSRPGPGASRLVLCQRCWIQLCDEVLRLAAHVPPSRDVHTTGVPGNDV